MMNGSLLVQTFAARQSAPVPNVQITVTGEGYDPITFVTDDNGIAEPVCLPAPDKELSLEEENNERPYSVWNVVAQKDGYQTVTMIGVQVFACETALALIEMLPQQRLGAPQPLTETFNIPAHSLYAPVSPSSTAPVTDCADLRVLTTPIIPKTITVHLGKPKESAQNVTVSFRSYIANVASSEVYPTCAG